MCTNRIYSLVFSLCAGLMFYGLGSTAVRGQQSQAGQQDKTQSAAQQNGQAGGQQTAPPDRQKTVPADLKKAKVKEATLDSHYKKWLDEDVAYIITQEERDTFKALTTDEERENFIDNFWMRRNADPREGGNEFKVEHYRRITYANERFASGVPGWKTDRGRIYIMYGDPDEKQTHPTGGDYNREMWEGGGNTTVYPFERWTYRHIDGVGDNVELEFVDKCVCGEYRLALDPEEKDMLLHGPSNMGLTENEENGVTNKQDRENYGTNGNNPWQRSQDMPFERLSRYFNVQKPPQIKFADLKSVVTARVIYNQLPYTMRTDFIRISPAIVMVPITVEMDNKNLEFKKEMNFNRASVHVYGEISTLQGNIKAEFEADISAEYTDEFFEAGKTKRSIYQNSVFLDSGQRYRLDLVLRDENSKQVGSTSVGIAVPKFSEDVLQASSVILADQVGVVAPTYDKLDQFVIGDMKVRPNVKAQYTNGNVLIPYLQIYNVQFDQTTLEPSLQISYLIKSGDKVLANFEDQKGRTIQFVSGQRVVLVDQIPIKGLEKGDYTLEIKILDRISNKSLTTGAEFHIVGPPSGQ